MSQQVINLLQSEFGEKLLEQGSFRGDESVVIAPENLLPMCKWLRDTPACSFDMLLDVAAVDYLNRRKIAERFEVVYHLQSLKHHHRLRLKVRLPQESPQIDSVTGIWKSADWFEREAYDLMGITFKGHPCLQRLLMFKEFVGHPLRKDYPIDRRPVIPTPDSMQEGVHDAK